MLIGFEMRSIVTHDFSSIPEARLNSKKDHKPPQNGKRMSLSEVDRSFFCIDDTSGHDGRDHSSPIRFVLDMPHLPAHKKGPQSCPRGWLPSAHHRENGPIRAASCVILRIHYTSSAQDLGFFRRYLVTMPGVLGLSVPTSVGIAVQD